MCHLSTSTVGAEIEKFTDSVGVNIILYQINEFIEVMFRYGITLQNQK